MIGRRKLLGAVGGLGVVLAAPAIVRYSSLMPVKPVVGLGRLFWRPIELLPGEYSHVLKILVAGVEKMLTQPIFLSVGNRVAKADRSGGYFFDFSQ